MSSKDQIKARITSLELELARLESLPVEPIVDNGEPSVIWFEKSFVGPKTYTYAAVLAGDGLWYATGPSAPRGLTWSNLVEWIGETTIWWATSYEALT